jgi:nucleotide-binding universal stress UspA family protein
MGKILCATRGGEASFRTQDLVIAKAKEEGDIVLFLYVADIEFLKQTARGVRHDVMQQEMDRMGNFLLTMACERAAEQGVEALPVLRHGSFAQALREVAVEEEATLVALGRPAGDESVFQLTGLQKLAQEIEQETGIPTQIF